jgi:hypothetical protein
MSFGLAGVAISGAFGCAGRIAPSTARRTAVPASCPMQAASPRLLREMRWRKERGGRLPAFFSFCSSRPKSLERLPRQGCLRPPALARERRAARASQGKPGEILRLEPEGQQIIGWNGPQLSVAVVRSSHPVRGPILRPRQPSCGCRRGPLLPLAASGEKGSRDPSSRVAGRGDDRI